MAKNSLTALIPQSQLSVTKSNLSAIVKHTPDEQLHTVLVRMRDFYSLFEEITKKEFISRAKTAKKLKKYIETSFGKIVFAVRNNYTFDIDALLKFVKRKGIVESDVFDTTYEVVTKHPQVLKMLVDKGFIIPIRKVNTVRFEAMAEVYPEMLSFVENNPTEYVKGL